MVGNAHVHRTVAGWLGHAGDQRRLALYFSRHGFARCYRTAKRNATLAVGRAQAARDYLQFTPPQFARNNRRGAA